MTVAMGWGDSARVALAAGMLAVGLLTNLIGMNVVGQVQIAVVLAIVSVLVLAIIGAVPHTMIRWLSNSPLD